jgi:hypothetical protein
MQPKKNPKADLNKNSTLYFAIGLCVILLISWQAIEWKTYDRSNYAYQALDVDDDDNEEVPLTEQLKTPPPPPPPPAPEIIEVVEDEEEVEETIIESTETTQEDIIEEVEVIEEDFDLDVPFAIIEDVPVYPGCENVPKNQTKSLVVCVRKKFKDTSAVISVIQKLPKKWVFRVGCMCNLSFQRMALLRVFAHVDRTKTWRKRRSELLASFQP